MPENTLDAKAVTVYLGEVATEQTSNGPALTIVSVGGSLLALLGLRDATRDVGGLRRLSRELLAARDSVARRYGLSDRH